MTQKAEGGVIRKNGHIPIGMATKKLSELARVTGKCEPETCDFLANVVEGAKLLSKEDPNLLRDLVRAF